MRQKTTKMYLLFRLAAVIVPRLPRRWLPALSVLLGWLAWMIAVKARRQATANMLHVLGPEVQATRLGRRRLRRTVRQMFINNVRNYLEGFCLPYVPVEEIVDNIIPGGEEHLAAALAQGKGVLIISAHFGPFDYLSQWLVARGYELVIPVEQLKDRRMLELMLNLRCSHGIKYLPVGNGTTMRAILRTLRQNQLVLITADRAVVGQSVEVPFFGAPARLPEGPALLAQRTGAALVGAFGWRLKGTRMQGEFTPISLALPEEERQNPNALMRSIVQVMERYIRAHPEQWLVFAPVWLDHPADSPAAPATAADSEEQGQGRRRISGEESGEQEGVVGCQ
uniref:Lipid A biosynthesis lauroyl acyltransferase n=1 Tax=Thermogemmatispora argillosa TaxID=2045280 RepID=A0A455T2P2_9CHLR|nr:lipid A biosynthesis lauroyl acyltransferase [Thermogemmatispora argillosa]